MINRKVFYLFCIVSILLISLLFISCATMQSTTKTTETAAQEKSKVDATVTEMTEPSNNPPVAKIQANITEAGIGEAITLSATDSSDPDDDNLTFEWQLPDKTTESMQVFTISFDEYGKYVIDLTVSDGELSDTASIEILIENKAPVAIIEGAAAEIKIGETVNLSAASSYDPDGDTLTYEWHFQDGAILEGVEAQHTPEIGGDYEIELVVSDGDKSGSEKIVIDVYEPMIYSGTGDSIVDINKTNEPMLVYIKGNSSSWHFAVKNYDINNESIELLVNTTEPYEGIRPLDFISDEWTARFEVIASGSWTIEILPLTAIDMLTVPGKMTGEGDYVFAISGGTPDTAIIEGNSRSRHFAVKSYGKSNNLLVNTTDPYNGEVILYRDTIIFEVIAEGSWSIEVTTR